MMLFVPWQKEAREQSRIHGACGEFVFLLKGGLSDACSQGIAMVIMDGNTLLK